jgi:hypothetical protein
MTPAEAAAITIMTFTVREVRAVKSGVSSGGPWTRYLITTTAGEKIGTFEPDWQLLTGDTISTEVKTTIIDGRPYLSVGKPPGAASSPSARRTPSPPAATDQDTKAALARIERTLADIITRLDAMAVVHPDADDGPPEKEPR